MGCLKLAPLHLTQYDQYALTAADKFRDSFEVAEAESMRLSCIYPQLESHNAILIGRHSLATANEHFPRFDEARNFTCTYPHVTQARDMGAQVHVGSHRGRIVNHPAPPLFLFPHTPGTVDAHTVKLTMSLNCP